MNCHYDKGHWPITGIVKGEEDAACHWFHLCCQLEDRKQTCTASLSKLITRKLPQGLSAAVCLVK